MATVTKDFRVKHGLVVEGTNATVNGSDIITEDAITGGTQTNITVTYNPTTKVVDFVAENGVADSTTDDLVEGEDNLYFTDQRAIAAVKENIALGDLSDVIATGTSGGDILTYSAGSWTPVDLPTVLQNTADTDDLPEGATNLYFTDARAQSAVATDISTAVSDHNDLTNGVHGVTGNVVGTSDTQELTNKTLGAGTDLEADLDANSYKIVNLATPTAEADAATKDYVDSSISNLVDGAPALLDTLNELAAALGDDENFAATVATDIGTKVSKAGDSMTGELAMGTNKITGLGTPTSDADAATKLYVDTAETDAISTAESYTDGEIATALTTAQGYATTAENNAIAHADALETDDVAEGSTNLYFTDVRAVDALEAVVPNFTAVEVNSVAKQVAATVSAPTSGDPVTAYAFAKATYRSAKFLVKVAYSTHTEVSEVLLTLDTSDNIAITEFAIVSTNGSASGISAGINGSNVELLVTPTNASSTVTVVGTLLA
jgi:hypothetical protein